MKVILLQDVKSLGKKDDIVDVSDGYARNFVLPKKVGIEATPKNLNELKLKKAHEDKVAAERLADLQVVIIQKGPSALEEGGEVVGIVVEEGRLAVGREQRLPMLVAPLTVVADADVAYGAMV